MAYDRIMEESDIAPLKVADILGEANHDHHVSSPQLCIICKLKQDDPLKVFDDKTWPSFKRAAECRLLLTSDRYRDITTETNLQTEKCNAVYHSKCYKNYTAVKRQSSSHSNDPPAKKQATRRQSSLQATDVRGLLKGSCIFCPVLRKTINQKVEPLSDCLTKDGCDAIIAASKQSSNKRIKALVSSEVDLIAKEAQYHKSCRREYFKEVEGTQSRNATVANRQMHTDTFDTISELIDTEVIRNHQAMLVSSILDLYKSEYLGAGGSVDSIEAYTTQALTKKIQNKFSDTLCISLFNRRVGNFLYNSVMSDAEARASLHDDEEKYKHHNMIRTAALHLRKVIHSMPKWKTPTQASVETLRACSPDMPEDIVLFYRTLMCGLREPSSDENRENVERKVMAMSSDSVFNVSRGLVRPWKHTVLGLGLGTLTGSKLTLRIMNRLGSCLSYNEVKALETEFAFSAEENDRDAPDGIELNPGLGTGQAWDNYDVNMETLDGKDTLHATVGICYQNSTSENEPVCDRPIVTHSGRNRRHFDGKVREIVPYYKQLKKACFNLTVSKEHAAIGKMVSLRLLDFCWFLQSRMKPVPLFAGFYSQFVLDELPTHKIGYMDPISASPTRNDVVRETMVRSMNVAKETHQEYGVVTYDLAVALKAYSIQSLDTPTFDRLLIMLGNFHLELAFYGAVGTYINESGVEYLLTESGMLAEGSLMGFIRGKYYNRCTRVHEILALVMERKLYESFLSTLTLEMRDVVKEILTGSPEDRSTLEKFLETNQLFIDHMQQYELFFNDVMLGTLGPTAQYWCIYIFMINRVHRDLMRAVRTNDVDSYVMMLPAVIDIFFGLNRPNYARWGVLYLHQLETAEPQNLMVLKKGAFSIRRTAKHFSRTAIDLTLEQTVNRDAASPMRGIVGFQNSDNAVRRWCITSTQRGMAVTELRRLTGLDTEEEPKTQLRSNRIEKDNRQMRALLNAVTESCDPFSAPAVTSGYLLNITTGKAAAQETQEYLTKTLTEGRKLREKFELECVDDESRLMKPIKRRKILNFACENTKKKPSYRTKGNSVTEGVRDAFIRMLVFISEKTNFDLEGVVTFPITELPLSIAHADGSLMKTPKYKLLKKLESMQNGFVHTALPQIDATLIDGGLLLHSFLSAIGNIRSYGKLASSLLSHVCSSSGSEIHVLFDTYRHSSLKESERKLRGADDRPFVISGSEQAPKQSCQKLLQNGIFKDQLAAFLLKEWRENHYGPILGNKTLVISHGGNCCRITYNEQDLEMTIEHPDHLQVPTRKQTPC